MKKTLLTLLMTLGLTLSVQAATQDQNAKAMPAATIKKMDRQMTQHKAKARNFATPKEYKRKQQRQVTRTKSKYMRYDNGSNYRGQGYRDTYRHPVRQRGYRATKRGWVLAYQYDRASFYDNEGFYYGYFNRYGYYFDDVFYSYDRYYTYRDRVRGRGLFSRLYYMPSNARYYGFETRILPANPYTHRDTRDYDRGYNRGYDRY